MSDPAPAQLGTSHPGPAGDGPSVPRQRPARRWMVRPDDRTPGSLAALLAWARVVVAVALGILVAVWSPSYYVTVAAAVALPVVAGRYALAAVVFFAVTAREAPDGRGFDAVTRLGSQIYYQGKIPVINFLAVSALLVAMVRLRRRGDRLVVGRTAWVLLGCLGALAALAFGLGIGYGQSVFSAANQNSRNFLTAAVGIAIGLLLMEFRDEISAVERALVGGLGLLVAVAAVAVVVGQAADPRVSRYFTYYDSALPAVAAAVFGALLVSRSRLARWEKLAMGLALTLVVIGFRLTIWLAVFVVLAMTVLLAREWKATAVRCAVSGAVTVACVLALPGMLSDITGRIGGASSVASGDQVAAPKSAAARKSFPASTSATPKPSATAQASPTPGQGAPTGSSATAGRSASARPSAVPGRSGSVGANATAGRSGSVGANATAGRSASVGANATASRGVPTRKDDTGRDVAAESSQGHFSDIRIAWSYVRRNFWTGIGPQHPQLPGLASDDTRVLYVHNEWLQDWLRFGPGAVLLVTVFLVLVAVSAARTLAGRRASVIRRAAAIFGLITPICLLVFPYLSKSNQWPLLIGVAAGILVAGSRQVGAEPPSLDGQHAATG